MIKVLYISNEDRSIGGASLSMKAMLDSLKGKVEPVILFREDGPACELFRGEGYECRVIPFRRATFHCSGIMRAIRFIPHWITTTWIQLRCVNKAKKEFADVNLVHGNSGAVDIGLRIARALGVPHVWHIREYLDLGLKTTPFPSWKHWHKELSDSDAVIAITPGLYSHLGLGSHRHGYCIPDAVCSASDAVIIPDKENYVAFISGTISRLKQPEEALRVFAATGNKGFKMKIVGSIDETYKHSLQSLAIHLGIDSSIEFVPFSKDIKPLLSKAAAVLVCTEFEGMGRVGVEAMFYGCPVIARNSGGSADLFADGRGFLYNDVREAAAALGKVLDSFPAGNVEKARKYAIDNYAIEKYADKILKVYNDVNEN